MKTVRTGLKVRTHEVDEDRRTGRRVIEYGYQRPLVKPCAGVRNTESNHVSYPKRRVHGNAHKRMLVVHREQIVIGERNRSYRPIMRNASQQLNFGKTFVVGYVTFSGVQIRETRLGHRDNACPDIHGGLELGTAAAGARGDGSVNAVVVN